MDLKSFTNSVPFVLCVFLGGPVGGMFVFWLTRKRNPQPFSARVQKAGGSSLLNLWMKEYGYWWLRPQARLLAAMGATPNAVTVGGLLMVYAGCVATAYGYFGIGGLTILLGSLSDMLDGMVARMRNMGCESGEFIDSVVDRYADLGLCGGLMGYYIDTPGLVALAGLAAAGSLLVSYTRAKAESLGISEVPSGPMQRAERAVYIGFGIFLSPVVARLAEAPKPHPIYGLAIAALAVVALLTHISALQMIRFVARALDDKARQTQDKPHAIAS